MSFYRTALVVLCCVLVAETQRNRRPHKKKPGNNNNNNNNKHDDNDAIAHLTGIVDELNERITQMSGSDESSCPGNNLHFFFHGDGDSHDHSDGDHNVHIDLHLDHDDHSSYHSIDHGHHDDHDHDDDHHTDAHDHHSDTDGMHNEQAAHCRMNGTSGFVHIVQGDHEQSANFMFHFDNLGEAHIAHMVHVHQFGDLSEGCKSLGGHYHVSDDDIGDLGTVETDSEGVIMETWINNTMLTLFGKHGIMGRGIIIHNTDRSPLACCVIGFSSENDDNGHGHGHHGH